METRFSSKLGHIAAVALIGWYLIAPPIDSHGNIRPDASFAYWELQMSFDTAAGCESARGALQDWAVMDEPRTEAQFETAQSDAEEFSLLYRMYQLEVQIPAAKCIASNDPRLR